MLAWILFSITTIRGSFHGEFVLTYWKMMFMGKPTNNGIDLAIVDNGTLHGNIIRNVITTDYNHKAWSNTESYVPTYSVCRILRLEPWLMLEHRRMWHPQWLTDEARSLGPIQHALLLATSYLHCKDRWTYYEKTRCFPLTHCFLFSVFLQQLKYKDIPTHLLEAGEVTV